MAKGNKQDRKSTNLRKKKQKAKGGGKGKTPEENLAEKMSEHVRSPGYVGHVPDWPDCVFENR